ncbi:uncharacterized protein LOC142625466 [Castanea sativa]|uniref:uncharacterized protein LOC142625466 n=1 Tax=Castanea sativa TaxID=21020 RepID=UPI003F6502F4
MKVIPQEMRVFKSDRYNNNRPRRDFAGQFGPIVPHVVNIVFREPVHQLLEKIRNEPYFKWPNKMAEDPTKRNQNLQCHYHQDVGHTTKNCRTLWNHLEQLVKEGRLKQFLYHPNGQGSCSGSVSQGNNSSRPHLGTINVIFAAPGRTGSGLTRVMAVARTLAKESNSRPKRLRGNTPSILGFSEEDKIGTIQPHDDALGAQLKARRSYGLRFTTNKLQGKGCQTKKADSATCAIQSRGCKCRFYCGRRLFFLQAIVARPWLHALSAVSSTLHVKVKFPSRELIEEIVGS